jgi:hypothetical protein
MCLLVGQELEGAFLSDYPKAWGGAAQDGMSRGEAVSAC